ETPVFFASFCIVGHQRSAHAVGGTVVPHEYFSLGHMRRARDSGLMGIAHGSFPCLFSGRSIDRNQPAISRAYINLPLPDGNPGISPRRVRTVDGLIQAYLGIEYPKQFPRSRVHRIYLRQWSTD